ncbi:helix-turn-helix domain-containing protein [Methylobacterium sp. E-066]|uniref:helix-turn-helix domain-containing protein n=1 Tax=Methylobacterium sp. E-066 TaxID=2836584 RepID=UPI001FB8AF19|nr:helix-turn-helix domain-containing protein [Methylobacterium sp. E-066]
MGWPACDQRRHPVSGVPYAVLRERARAMRLEIGASLDAIAAELGVTTAAVSKWVSDLPEHAAIVEANHQARAERRRLYPVGTRPYVTKLIRAGIAPAERIRLAQEAAR